MKVCILGSAAGGGVPQWNCRCSNCEAVRAGAPHVQPRTQSSVAISADGREWFLLNVSPDVRQQILAFPPLGPPEGMERGQGIAGCVLTDAELDHTAGLLLLREGKPFGIFSTPLVRQWLSRSFPLETLLASFARPEWVDLSLDKPMMLPQRRAGCHTSSGLLLRAFELGLHVPRFVKETSTALAGSVIGLLIEDSTTGGKLVYAPGVGSMSDALLRACKEADVVMIDGTFWSEDEPLRFGLRAASEMGHVPVSGPRGSLVWLANLSARHRVYVHINNSNPMLNENGPEHRLVASRGVRVGADGDIFEI